MSNENPLIPPYPLHWPEGVERTTKKAESRFKATLPTALQNVRKSLQLFAGDSGFRITGVSITSNATLLEARPADTGVAVWFMWDGEQRCIAVDRYAKIEDNLQAIHHILEARRVELRHGGLPIVRQTFKGFAALPPPEMPWWSILGLAPGAPHTRDDVIEAHRKLASSHHPDRSGGNDAQMAEINRARDLALASITGGQT